MFRRLIQEEKGAAMLMAATTLTTLLLFAGLALDFGRAHLLKAQLQTAVDAAALAGALQVVPMVELSIVRWVAVEDWCRDPTSGTYYHCLRWEDTSPARVQGTHRDLVRLGRWLQAAGPQCQWPYSCDGSYRIVREWLILPESTLPAAEATFYMNSLWPASSQTRLERLNIRADHHKIEVTASATLSTPTTFLKLAGIRSLQLTRTGSAEPVRR